MGGLAAVDSLSRLRNHPAGILGGGGAVLYVLFIGLPVIALLVQAAQQTDFLDAVTGDAALTALRLSLLTSVISMAVVVVLGTPFAYLLARSDSMWARVVDSLVELPLVLPPVVAGVAMLMAFGRNGLIGPGLENIGITIPFTTTAVVFAQIFVASPFFIRAAKLGFQSVAKDFEDIAKTLGVSPWRTFLPNHAPPVRARHVHRIGLGLGPGAVRIWRHHDVRREPDRRDPDDAAGNHVGNGDSPRRSLGPLGDAVGRVHPGVGVIGTAHPA